MSASTIKQLSKATVEMEISIPWDEIQVSYDKILSDIVVNTEIEGFRKGKAPKKLVEEKLDKNKLFSQVIQDTIPKVYAQEIKKHSIVPITSPKIEVLKAKAGEDWAVKVTIAQKPKINLKNYKEKIRELRAKGPKIWVPGQEKKKEEEKKPDLDAMMKVLHDEVEVELSDILVSEEANRLLSDLIDQTRKLGLTVEQYLIAKGKTTQQVRAEFALQAQSNLTLQFALSEIAEKENITVTPQDIEGIIAKVEKPEERERLRKDSYYLAHLIRQQKTIDYLANL